MEVKQTNSVAAILTYRNYKYLTTIKEKKYVNLVLGKQITTLNLKYPFNGKYIHIVFWIFSICYLEDVKHYKIYT